MEVGAQGPVDRRFGADVVERAAVHAALGEPIRLAIVDELVRSDRSPAELARRFDLATNLLAHHLGVLERAGLVERSPSSGDGRRRYVRIVADAAAGAGVRAAGAPHVGSAVFVCTHNSARSQLAAALWHRRTGAAATSAGTHPADRVHPGAAAAARRRGLDLGAAVPRALADGELAEADLVVTVCDRAHEEIDLPPTALHWSIADPVGATPSGAVDPFDAAAAALEHRIDLYVAPSLEPDPRRRTP